MSDKTATETAMREGATIGEVLDKYEARYKSLQSKNAELREALDLIVNRSPYQYKGSEITAVYLKQIEIDGFRQLIANKEG